VEGSAEKGLAKYLLAQYVTTAFLVESDFAALGETLNGVIDTQRTKSPRWRKGSVPLYLTQNILLVLPHRGSDRCVACLFSRSHRQSLAFSCGRSYEEDLV
jgi:hypothetical protein